MLSIEIPADVTAKLDVFGAALAGMGELDLGGPPHQAPTGSPKTVGPPPKQVSVMTG